MGILIVFFTCFFLVTTSNLQAQTINPKHIKSTIFISDNLLYPSDLALVDNLLFVKDQLKKTGTYGIKVFDIANGRKIYAFVRQGRGPGEYLDFDIRKGPDPHTLEITDSKNRKNDIYDTNCLKKYPPFLKTSKCIIKTTTNLASHGAIILHDNYVINTGATPQGVLFLSKGEKILNHLDSVPKVILQKYGGNPQVAALAMAGYLGANRERKKIAFFAENYNRYIFFIRKGNMVQKITAHDSDYLPTFDVSNYGGNSALIPSNITTYSYGSPSGGENHIYVPYSGKSNINIKKPSEDIEWRVFTKHIFVFNWNGQKENEFVLTHQVSNIAVNFDETVLFGITYSQDLKPSIVKARLK